MSDTGRITKAQMPGHTGLDYMTMTTFATDGASLSKHLRMVVEGDGADISIEVFGVRMTYHLDGHEMLDTARWLQDHVTSRR